MSPKGIEANGPLRGIIQTPSLALAWAELPWDTLLFGRPVLQIERLEIHGSDARTDFSEFERARDSARSRLVSCRLPCAQLQESMLLEDVGFRFVEMVYLPELSDINTCDTTYDPGLIVSMAGCADLPVILEIAGKAFLNERFHVDPRLSSDLADQRYRNWVSSSLDHFSQRLYVLREDKRVIAFFVTELLADGTCYWHLNAVAPEAQGKGYGRRAWVAMLRQACREGARCVRTSITARNSRVLNLYARLGFRFPPPLMTFHWVHPVC